MTELYGTFRIMFPEGARFGTRAAACTAENELSEVQTLLSLVIFDELGMQMFFPILGTR